MARAKYLIIALLPFTAQAEEVRAEGARAWTVQSQAGFANTFQMTLGGMFGRGPDFQDRVTAGVNNIWKAGDTLSVFGWSTTDLKSARPNWQAGLTYRLCLIHNRRHSLFVGGGAQRWLLPSVKTGARDWLLSGTLTYATAVRHIPIVVNENCWSLLRSTLPKGSALHTQIYSQHTVWKGETRQLFFREGPEYSYSWGFYGAQGNRVLRYAASLVLAWKNTTLEAGYRQQLGLQDGIPCNRYWSFLLSRQLSRRFR